MHGLQSNCKMQSSCKMHDPAHLFWSHKVHSWLQGQSVGLSIEDDLDVSTVIGNAKNHYAQTWHQSSC